MDITLASDENRSETMRGGKSKGKLIRSRGETIGGGDRGKLRERSRGREQREIISGKASTARYIPVRQLTGTGTDRYQAVPLKSTVDSQFRPLAVNFDRRRSIKGEIDRRRSIKEEKGKRKKKKNRKIRKKKKRRRRNTSLPAARLRALAAREQLFYPREETERLPKRKKKYLAAVLACALLAAHGSTASRRHTRDVATRETAKNRPSMKDRMGDGSDRGIEEEQRAGNKFFPLLLPLLSPSIDRRRSISAVPSDSKRVRIPVS
ncbi:hypothetical protein BHE74_00019182 [Ensete ventricosum]|nr:hypothetical protein BHE74_00019182 [Ensete ventricosum]